MRDLIEFDQNLLTEVIMYRTGRVNQLDTTVCRKLTNSELYINRHAHTPQSWKVGTLKMLLMRAYKPCSNETLTPH